MVLKYRLSALSLVWLLALLSANSSAHQMKAAISNVLFNQRTNSIEFMHRFYVHDAEHALSQLTGEQVYLEENKTAQKAFASYVVQHFSFGLASPTPVNLTNVGQEVDGKFIWVYQEYAMPQEVPELWFRFDALQEYWPGQINQVNIEGLGKVKSLQFDNHKRWQSVSF